MPSFAASLSPDQLVFARSRTAQKCHVVRLRCSAYEETGAGSLRHKSLEAVDKLRGQWSATALCDFHAKHSNTPHPWNPLRDPSPETVCKGCLHAWKKLGEPEIAGWDHSGRPQDEWPWELPFGWLVTPVCGHPWDVPADKSIEGVRDKKGTIVGEHRVELQRWIRGPRVVRLVHFIDTGTYDARYWRIDAEPEDERGTIQGTLQHARQACHKLMAQGGY